jgi:Skp family chaperone for outer membrane proteins
MKKYFYIASLFLLAFLQVKAQPPQADDKLQQIEAIHIAYITKELNLTTEEAQKFWPVYNTYQAEAKQLMKEHNDKKGSALEWDEKILNLRKKYRTEFLKAINENKFNRFIRAENAWRNKLRERLKDRIKNRINDRQPGTPPQKRIPPRQRPTGI